MELNVTKSNLQRALNAVSKAVSNKPTIEILKNIDLVATQGTLKVSATNTEMSITTIIGADIVEDGETTVSAKTFTEFVSLLPEGNVTLKFESGELKVESNKTKSKFATVPHEEFPELPKIDEESILFFKMDKETFVKTMDKSIFASDKSGISQPVFSGIFFESSGSKMNIVATDRYRLSKTSLEMPDLLKDIPNPIIPASALENLLKLSESSEDDFIEAYLVSKNNQILFKSGRTELSSNLLDGEFPNYQAFMPQRTICTYSVNVAAFMDSVKLSSVFGKQEESLKVVIAKTLESDLMRLSSKVSEVGEYETELPVEVIAEEESIEINFSPRKILDILSKIYTENVILEVVIHPRTEHKMLIFKEESNDRYMHLLTPMIGA